DQSLKQADLVGQADPQHDRENDADGGESDEVRDCVLKDELDTRAAQQALDRNILTAVRMYDGYTSGRKKCGCDHDDADEPEEDDHRFGQLVPEPLDPVKQPSSSGLPCSRTG